MEYRPIHVFSLHLQEPFKIALLMNAMSVLNLQPFKSALLIKFAMYVNYLILVYGHNIKLPKCLLMCL